MSAELEVQKALYLALSGAGLTVVDAEKQASDAGSTSGWPYVEVGEIFFDEWDTNTDTGHEFTARIHTRSRSKSKAEAKGIQGQIYGILHRQPLTITGQVNPVLYRETSFCGRAPDGTFHGVCEYHGFIQAT